ncbi:hypothetical protein Patl1_20340 [Pistacia atlantica]|uniref:Uncharacterized protein n=1 Tax=Pistacia atlantica TaxID=434234 RepID=A0ACC1BMQ4_9ROSI|nr:hypothetical protein Patl1_20340 [Pistacia atlantica]
MLVVVWWVALVHGQTEDSGELCLEMQQQKTAFLQFPKCSVLLRRLAVCAVCSGVATSILHFAGY